MKLSRLPWRICYPPLHLGMWTWWNPGSHTALLMLKTDMASCPGLWGPLLIPLWYVCTSLTSFLLKANLASAISSSRKNILHSTYVTHYKHHILFLSIHDQPLFSTAHRDVSGPGILLLFSSFTLNTELLSHRGPVCRATLSPFTRLLKSFLSCLRTANYKISFVYLESLSSYNVFLCLLVFSCSWRQHLEGPSCRIYTHQQKSWIMKMNSKKS